MINGAVGGMRIAGETKVLRENLHVWWEWQKDWGGEEVGGGVRKGGDGQVWSTGVDEEYDDEIYQ
jgi:hypothetical protein